MDKISANQQVLSTKNLSNEQKAEVRKAIVQQYQESAKENTLARSPQSDKFMMEDKCIGAVAFSPKVITETAIGITAMVTALQSLAKAGFDVWDMFISRFGKPESKEEEKALKAALNIEG